MAETGGTALPLKTAPHPASSKLDPPSLHKMFYDGKWEANTTSQLKVLPCFESFSEVTLFLKVMSDIFLLFSFLIEKNNTFRTRKMVSPFTSKALFVLELLIF